MCKLALELGDAVLQILVTAWRQPSATEKILVEVWLVWMNRSPILPALELQAVSHAAEAKIPFNTPFLSSVSLWLAL